MDSPTHTDLRAVVDDLLPRIAVVRDDAWDRPAHHLEWTCRETIAHLMDDFTAYALQLSGATPPTRDYLPLVEAAQVRPDGPHFLMLPEREAGTAGIVQALDATGGLLEAVCATAPPERRGFHPRGTADASGFAAMGITECVLHAFDVLTAMDVPYAADPAVCAKVLDRLFTGANRTDDPWHDLLAASGRTPETRGQQWTWDSSVRD
jgi:Mycothiol maleylpyruvate isomerase N-terminal domain